MKEKLKTMNRDDFKFEICANSVESCLAAQEGGANRVELCAGIPEGGTTPSYGEIKVARKLLNETKLHVIIRPRVVIFSILLWRLNAWKKISDYVENWG